MQGKRQYNEYSQGRKQQQQQGGYDEGDGDVAMKRARGPGGGRKQRRQQSGEGGGDGDEAMHDVEVRRGSRSLGSKVMTFSWLISWQVLSCLAKLHEVCL